MPVPPAPAAKQPALLRQRGRLKSSFYVFQTASAVRMGRAAPPCGLRILCAACATENEAVCRHGCGLSERQFCVFQTAFPLRRSACAAFGRYILPVMQAAQRMFFYLVCHRQRGRLKTHGTFSDGLFAFRRAALGYNPPFSDKAFQLWTHDTPPRGSCGAA
ncbi:hypothetical protein [Kingella potus]|uniref:hypothetical protein n=1 Tax=Kingella potus TaxID=265175 RepID=UPI001FD4CB90|nr:hypothetical protein [Kingella potus]UOP00105.1 hypothetical protein LVJ84_09025 [Kingella potus]